MPTTPATTDPDGACAAVELNSADLARCLRLVTPHVSHDPDELSMVLRSVHLEVTPEDLTFVGTDRYTLGAVRYPLPATGHQTDGPLWAATLDLGEVNRLLAKLGSWCQPVRLQLSALDGDPLDVVVEATTRWGTVTLPTQCGEYLDWRDLLARYWHAEPQGATPHLWFSPELAGRFANLETELGESPVWHFRGPRRPIVITTKRHYRGLLAPKLGRPPQHDTELWPDLPLPWPAGRAGGDLA